MSAQENKAIVRRFFDEICNAKKVQVAKVPGVRIHRIANGKIAESWNVWDTLGLLQQLGVFPAGEKLAS